jgi:hypothetical protein
LQGELNLSIPTALPWDAYPRGFAMQVLRSLRHRIERLGPYPSLLLVAVPLTIVEPLKLAVLFIAGDGHWITGAITMICAYAVSLFVAHWVFGIVKPKLMTLPWFAAAWNWLTNVWQRLSAWFGFGGSRKAASRKPTVAAPVQRRRVNSASRP